MKTLENYIVSCPTENVLFNDKGQPYELINGCKVALSLKKEAALSSYNSKSKL